MINFSTALCYVDRICDYIPVVSAISNLLPKLTLYVIQHAQNPLSNRYIKHISAKSTWRCGIAAIPLIGNIAIAIFDAVNILATNNHRELVNNNAQLIKGTINQYTQDNNSACTRYACLFLTSVHNAVTPDSINDILHSLEYGRYKGQHENTENVIQDFPNLLLQANPWPPYILDMQASKNPQSTGDKIPDAMNYLINKKDIHAALITSMGTTIAMRKKDNAIEFFDSHGDRNITGEAVAYVYRCDSREASDFLMEKFLPMDDVLADTVCFWPLQITI